MAKIDKNTGRKKYKVILDPYLTESNALRAEIPYRIFIGLDSSKPINLSLVYDKVELQDDGNIVSQTLNYSETINAVPYFNQVEEESLVVSKSGKTIYAIKKFNKKYSEIFKHNLNYNSYQIFVPRKALIDNRTYEAFNWRIVARVNQPVNYDIVDNSQNAEDSGEIKQRTINVGVLYDSLDTTRLENIKPYIFVHMANALCMMKEQRRLMREYTILPNKRMLSFVKFKCRFKGGNKQTLLAFTNNMVKL